MIARIAKSEIFNKSGSGLTNLECAEEANLYEAFNFLAHENALGMLQNSKI